MRSLANATFQSGYVFGRKRREACPCKTTENLHKFSDLWRPKSACSHILFRSAGTLRSTASVSCGISPVDPFQHISHSGLLRSTPRHPTPRGQDELSAVQALGSSDKTYAIMPKNLGEIAPTPAEDIEIAGMGLLKALLEPGQSQAPCMRAAHIGVAGRDPDPDAARNRNHRRLRTSSTSPQRLSVDILVNADALAITGALVSGSRRGVSGPVLPPALRSIGRFLPWRPAPAQGCAPAEATVRHSPPPPCEHQTRCCNAVLPRDLRHYRTRCQCVSSMIRTFIVARPATRRSTPLPELLPASTNLKASLKATCCVRSLSFNKAASRGGILIPADRRAPQARAASHRPRSCQRQAGLLANEEARPLPLARHTGRRVPRAHDGTIATKKPLQRALVQSNQGRLQE